MSPLPARTGVQAGEIRVQGLTRRFGAKVAVHPFALCVGPGGVTGLLGPNGSGKSTFMRMLLGLVPPDAGTARFGAVELVGDGTAVRRQATYMPGEIAVYGELSGREHLRWLVAGREPGAFPRAVELAGGLELPLDRAVRGYSHGMKRQLLFAAAMAPDVPVRILDEPTEGLDPTKRQTVLEHLHAEAERGVTILLSSHHLGEVERACDRILFLKDGRLCDEQDALELRERARRVVRLSFREPLDPARARERFQELCRSLGLELGRVAEREVTLFVPGDDPCRELGRLLSAPDLPEPSAVVFGELSLRELYRELYGTEGV